MPFMSILRTLTILFKGVLASLYVLGLQLPPKRKTTGETEETWGRDMTLGNAFSD